MKPERPESQEENDGRQFAQYCQDNNGSPIRENIEGIFGHSANPPVIKSVYCDCKDRSSFYRDKEDNDICYDCDLMIKQ